MIRYIAHLPILASLLFFSILKARSQQITVSNEKMNVLYIGVVNPVSVGVEGTPCSEIEIKTNCGEHTPSGNCKYDFLPTMPGDCTIEVYVNKNGHTKKLGENKYRVKFIPDPVAKVGGKSAGGMPTHLLQSQIGVTADIENFCFDARMIVTSYTVTISRGNNDIFQKQNYGPDFDGEVTGALKKIKPGDTIRFTEIKAKGPDSRIRALNDIILKCL
jgi:hypothetical protein